MLKKMQKMYYDIIITRKTQTDMHKNKTVKKTNRQKKLKQNSYLVAARASWGAMLPTAWIDQLLIV